MSLSIKIHRPYACDPLGLHISLVNKYINLITFYWSTLLIIYINI